MKELFRCMRAELVKMRHTFLYPLHIAVPIVGSALFLIYYYRSAASDAVQISAYIQVIGIALPLAVSIVCAGNVGLEEEKHFQTFFGSSVRKWNSFWAKCLALFWMGSMAMVGAVVFFAAGYCRIPGRVGVSAGIYGCLAAVLCMGSLPLYLEHLFLNLSFSKSVSLGVGVAQFLLAALFLTGLGDGRWPFFPCTWSARGAALLLTCLTQKKTEDCRMREINHTCLEAVVVCSLILILICVIIRVWFHFFEGRKCND